MIDLFLFPTRHVIPVSLHSTDAKRKTALPLLYGRQLNFGYTSILDGNRTYNISIKTLYS